ncbi:MAG TPA: AAA family ATPase [Steroidobacteraceae bacterium]|nr:AAA family ATPase [Steroidobacteraceae bacterium]
MASTRYLQFGAYRLDLAEGRLWRNASAIPLSRKAFGLLSFLAEHAGQLVTKEALLAAVWPRSVVVEAVLTTAVREVRRALEDRARQPAYVQTVHGRGYRFVAPVQAHDDFLNSPNCTAQPLVGRDPEWAELRARFAAAFAGQRQIVFVAGESGIGKTALVDAFVTQLAAESSFMLLRGQCIEHYGTGEAYLPILEALGRLGAGSEAAHLTQLLRQYAPSWLPHLPALHTENTTGKAAASQSTSLRMLRELTEALDRFAADRPVVFVLEDLQWSDNATLDWLGYAARRRDPARLLVLATYRPVDVIVQIRPLRTIVSELTGLTNCTRIMLDYLSVEAVAHHISLRFKGLCESETLARLLYKRTSGHPLFLVTILETLVHDGMLTRESGSWRLRGPFAAVADLIPVSVSQFIERRIEVLSPDDQRLLEAASAAGESFAVATLTAAVGGAEDRIEARCEQWARQRQLLLPGGSDIWPDGTATSRYRFRHALFHDVIYRRVSAGRRVRIHRAIGETLARAYGTASASIAAELAVHFELGGNVPQAVTYLETAVQRAIKRSAYAEARSYAEKALTLLEQCAPSRPDQELRLQQALATALMATRGWAVPEVEQALRRARALADDLGDRPQIIVALWGLIAVSVVRADLLGTRALSLQLLALTQKENAVPFQLAGHMELAGAALGLGDLALAEQEFSLADRLYDVRQHGEHLTRVGCDLGVFLRSWWSHLCWQQGQAARALKMSDSAVALARTFEHPFTLAIALAYAAILQQFNRNLEAATTSAREAIALCAEHGFVYYRTWAEIILGWCEGMDDPAGHGVSRIEQGIDALSAASVQRSLPYFHGLLAEIRLRRGESAAAERALVAALEIVAATGERWWEAELSRMREALVPNLSGSQQ